MDLNQIFEQHKLWINTNKIKGIRANLEGTNLEGANLRGANLEDANIMTFQANKHFAFYHEGIVKIGCYTLSLKTWLKKYKIIGKKENYTNLEIKMYGAWLKLLPKTKVGAQYKEIK